MKSLIAGVLMLLALAGCGSGDGDTAPTDNTNPNPPVITTQPADLAVTAGAAATFMVSATGDITSYRWQRSTDGGGSWTDIAGATTSTLALTSTTLADDSLRFRVLITGAGGTVTSATARLTVTAPSGQPGAAPVILVHPETVTVPLGQSATFTVTAEGPQLSYQWWLRGEGWDPIPGATSATLRTGDYDVEINGGNTIRVEVSNPFGSVTSEEARIWFGSPDPGIPDPGNPGDPSGPTLPPGCPGPQCIQPVPGATGLFPRNPSPLMAAPTFGNVTGVTFRGWRKIQGGGVHQDDQVWHVTLSPGVTATITLPWSTFLEDLDLQFTPVTAMDGLPFTSLVGAIAIVNSEAEEFGLAQPERPYTVTFTLTQDAAATASAAHQTLFVADADGGNLHLVPVVSLDASLTNITVRLERLGIVGLAHATDDQRQTALGYWPTTIADQFAAAQAEFARLLRLDALAAPGSAAKAAGRRAKAWNIRAFAVDDSFADQRIAHLTSRYNDVVAPTVAAAYGDHSRIGDAINELLSWDREVQLVQLDDPTLDGLSDRVMPTVMDLFGILADDIMAACRQDGGGFERVAQMIGVMRQIALLGMDAKLAELEAALEDCFRFRLEFKHERDRQVQSSASYDGGWYDNVSISMTAQDTGTGLLEGDVWSFLHTVVGGAPEGPLGVDLNYNFSHDSDSYREQFISAPVWGVVPVRTTHHSTCHATEDQVLGAKIKDFGLVRYPGGRRAVRLRLIDWGQGMIRCEGTATTVITWGGGTITEGAPFSNDSDYNTLTQMMFGFPDLRSVDYQTWEVLLKPEGGGYRWRSTRNANAATEQRREEFEITLQNNL